MADREIRRKPRSVAPVLDEDVVEELVEEEVQTSTPRRSKVRVGGGYRVRATSRVATPVEEDPEPEPEVVEPPKKKTRLEKKQAKEQEKRGTVKVESGNGQEEEPIVSTLPYSLSKAQVSQTLFEMLENMRDGEVYRIERADPDSWRILLDHSPRPTRIVERMIEVPTVRVKDGKIMGLPRKEYWEEVLSIEFKRFQAEWNDMTREERLLTVKNAGVTWDESDDEKINLMRASQAFAASKGITKYKKEYQDRKKRAAIRGF